MQNSLQTVVIICLEQHYNTNTKLPYLIPVVYMMESGWCSFFRCRRNKENVPPDEAATHPPSPDSLDTTSDVLHHAPPDLPDLREALHPAQPYIATGTPPVITNILLSLSYLYLIYLPLNIFESTWYIKSFNC